MGMTVKATNISKNIRSNHISKSIHEEEMKVYSLVVFNIEIFDLVRSLNLERSG
jgi:hypothetical protein